ncbi:MAG TPA: methyl-accepting chemotaxis protein, partial [Aquabacterium sp.]|nr:methyl-accepting chemotaxis protein [Aquabacterium sp.]
LDQSTQQNAALVEESMAAAESLRSQANRLAQAVTVFKTHHASSAQMQAVEVISRAQVSSTRPVVSTSVSAKVDKVSPQLPPPVQVASNQFSSDSGDWETF